MRYLLPFVFLLLCDTILPAADLSPIVDSQTIAVVRVDLKQVDMAKITQFLVDEVTDIVPQIQSNQEEAAPILFYAQAGIMTGAMYVQPILSTLQNEGKADEIFFLIDKKAADEQICPLFVAVPAPDSKPKEEVDAIRKLFLQTHLPVVFQRHGFLIGMPVLDDFGLAGKDDVMDFAKERFADPSTEKRPEFAEAFGRSDIAGSMIQIVFGFSMFAEEWAAQPDVPETVLARLPPEFREMIEVQKVSRKLMTEKLNYVTTGLDIQKPELKSVTSMTDEAAAREMLEVNEKTIQLYVQLIRQNDNDSPIGAMLPTLTAVLEEFQPKVIGGELHFSFDTKMYASLKKAVVEIVPISTSKWR